MNSFQAVVARLRTSRAARNATASYLAFFSSAACSLFSVPLAVQFLAKDQIGLWLVLSQVTAYLLWMDLGVGGATGRKMADAVAARDQDEIDRWWTAIRGTLIVLGLATILVGFALIPVLLGFLDISNELRGDAIWLLLSSVIICGVSMPMRSVPGLLTAQERFHWIPLGQAVIPWISLITFALLLNNGVGLLSYLWATALAQFCNWIYYFALVRTSPQKPRWSSEGFSRKRLKSLFGYSINLSVIGFMDAVLISLPALILAKLGGLAMVPPYAFTGKGPFLIGGIVRRTMHAFYPRLLMLYVSGDQQAFLRKFREVSYLTVAVGAIAAGVVLAGNRAFIEVIAGVEFYAGHAVLLWFCVGTITVPLAGLFLSLLQFAGKMGKSGIASILQVVVAGAAAIFLYNHFGLSGVAASFAVIPILYGSYCCVIGARECGFSVGELCGPALVSASVLIITILAAAWMVKAFPDPGPTMEFLGRVVRLPGRSEVMAGGTLVIVGLLFVVRISAKAFFPSSLQPKAS